MAHMIQFVEWDMRLRSRARATSSPAIAVGPFPGPPLPERLVQCPDDPWRSAVRGGATSPDPNWKRPRAGPRSPRSQPLKRTTGLEPMVRSDAALGPRIKGSTSSALGDPLPQRRETRFQEVSHHNAGARRDSHISDLDQDACVARIERNDPDLTDA